MSHYSIVVSKRLGMRLLSSRSLYNIIQI